MILQIFLNKKFLLVKSNYLHYCDVYEHGKLGISVTTSLIMALIVVIKNKARFGHRSAKWPTNDCCHA